MNTKIKPHICIMGLGYVGLPLAVEFSKHYQVTGFDIDSKRINELHEGFDKTGECSKEILENASSLFLSSEVKDLVTCTCFIITVPTPVDVFKKPDLKSLLSCTEMVSSILKKGDTVIYESTV